LSGAFVACRHENRCNDNFTGVRLYVLLDYIEYGRTIIIYRIRFLLTRFLKFRLCFIIMTRPL
jgi:hypothetical protein